MRRLSEQNDALMGEALGEAGQLVEIAERLRGFGDEMAQRRADRLGALRGDQESGGVARAFRIDLGFFLGRTGLGPAFLADQRHEGDGAEILFLEVGLAEAFDAEQSLVHVAPDRDHQPSADGELALERLGHARDRRPTR